MEHPSPHERWQDLNDAAREPAWVGGMLQAEKRKGEESEQLCSCGRAHRWSRWCWHCWREMLDVSLGKE
jgi:hypothetical protein